METIWAEPEYIRHTVSRLNFPKEEQQRLAEKFIESVYSPIEQANSVMGGSGRNKITYYSHVNDYLSFFYDWLMNSNNTQFRNLFFGITSISALSYTGKNIFEAVKEVQVKKYNADIVCCNFMYVFPDGRKLQNFADTGNIRLISPKEMIVSIFQERISSSSWSKIYKKDIFSKWTFPEGYTFEDHRLIYKIIADCNICVYIDKSLYYYLQREDSIVHDLTFKRRYHYFLADYERILFAQNYPEFSDTEKARIIKKQFDICFNNHFGGFMTVPGAPKQSQMINDMKHKLLSFLKSDYISRHDRRALYTIKYLWYIYDWTHFLKFRRRRARKTRLKSIQSGKPGMHVFNG